MKRIESGKEEAQRVRGALKIDIIRGISHKKCRVVDHDEVLCRRRALRHPHQLDRHATTVADRVLLRGSRAVREPNPGGKGAGLREDADTQRRRKIIQQHSHVPLHARLGVRDRLSPRRAPDPRSPGRWHRLLPAARFRRRLCRARHRQAQCCLGLKLPRHLTKLQGSPFPVRQRGIV
jgi:hypothetical protein